MATTTSSQPSDERTNKRMKGDGANGAMPIAIGDDGRGAPFPPQQPPGQQPMPPQQRYAHPGSYGGPHMAAAAANNNGYWAPQYGHPQQQGGPPPPPAAHHPGWGGGGASVGYPAQARGMTPDRGGGGGNWNPNYRHSRKVKPDHGDMEDDKAAYWNGTNTGGPPSYGSRGGPPPYGASNWQGSGMTGMYSSQAGHTWGATNKSPPRMGRSRHPGDGMMYRGPPPELDSASLGGYMSTRTIQHLDDDGASSSAGGSAKDKGRGSYRCGRCGVPKKGHVCPYQPKVKRRPDEPPPETRNAAVQVELDEFMTLRRLNVRIQGFPESYVTEPFMGESMVVGEPNPLTMPAPPLPQEEMFERGPPVGMGGANPPNAVLARGGDAMPPKVSSKPAEVPRSSPSSQQPLPMDTSAPASHEIGVGDDPVDAPPAPPSEVEQV